jgi:hypothetical protein
MISVMSTFCGTLGNLNLVLDKSGGGRLVLFDMNWSLLNFYYVFFPNDVIILTNTLDLRILVTSSYGIYNFDRNLSLINFYTEFSANYDKIYYNSSVDHFLILSSNYQRIDVFDQSLKLLKSISTAPYVPFDIDVFNDLAYVSTNKATILILRNEIIIGNFSILTPCYIVSSIIDHFGNIAVLCSRNMIYVYSLNGTYLGVKWSSTVFNIDDIQIDLSGS